MNENKAEGKFDQMKGKVKQSVGEALGNERMANSGAADQVKGAAKESWGATKEAFKDVRDRNTASDTSRASTTDRDTTATGHDVRQKVVSSAQNVKESIKDKADNFRKSA
jgi:uncharacterized protein YjbJ (UPF0337 family)